MRRTTYTVRVEITCPRCGATDWREESDPLTVPEPNEMFEDLEREGWSRDTDLCPACCGAVVTDQVTS